MIVHVGVLAFAFLVSISVHALVHRFWMAALCGTALAVVGLLSVLWLMGAPLARLGAFLADWMQGPSADYWSMLLVGYLFVLSFAAAMLAGIVVSFFRRRAGDAKSI